MYSRSWMRKSIHYFSLQQENGFQLAFSHRIWRQAEGTALSNSCRLINWLAKLIWLVQVVLLVVPYLLQCQFHFCGWGIGNSNPGILDVRFTVGRPHANHWWRCSYPNTLWCLGDDHLLTCFGNYKQAEVSPVVNNLPWQCEDSLEDDREDTSLLREPQQGGFENQRWTVLGSMSAREFEVPRIVA